MEAAGMARTYFAEVHGVSGGNLVVTVLILEFRSAGEGNLTGREIERMHVGGSDVLCQVVYAVFKRIDTVGIVEIVSCVEAFGLVAAHESDRFVDCEHPVHRGSLGRRSPVG